MKNWFIAGMAILLNGALLFGQAGTAYIQDFAGMVELKAPGAAEWVAVQRGARIGKDTMISTGFKSTALIALENSTLIVRPLTRLSLEDLQNVQGNESVRLNLQTGRVRAEVRPPAGGKTDFTVRTPLASASVRGTSFDFDGVNLSVDEGRVYVTGKDGVGVYVGAGHGSASNPETGRTAGPAELFWAELTLASPATAAGRTRPAVGRTRPEAAGGARPEATEGTVTVQLDPESGWAQAFTPEVISGFHYELEFRKTDGRVINRGVPQGTGSIDLTLALGEWTATARAYDSGNVLKAAG
ncbi:MAG: FecR family protein, partial [Treponema sp.]|nr:FecR family protein [Treponema sp.]